MSDEKRASMWRMWGSVTLGGLLLLLLGFEAGAEGMRMQQPAESAQPACATAYGKNVSQQGWDFAQQAIRQQHETIARLNAQLKETREAMALVQQRAADAAGNLAMQCPQWNPSLPRPDATAFTVLYESGRASVNVSLLPLPGAPRVALSPNSQLAPRWIVPGRIQPKMVGESRQAIYYYFDAGDSTWQGPFAPLRVKQ